MSEPKVSIGLPVFNGEKYLEEAITSVLQQDFRDFELIISDNASTDRTQQIVERFAAQDQRIKYVRHAKNIGAAPNYNYVVSVASGEYFQWFAHDDRLDPTFLSTCLQEHESREDLPMIVYPAFTFIDANSKVLSRSPRSVVTTAESPVQRLQETMNTVGAMVEIYGLFRREMLLKTRLVGSFVSSDFILLAECALLGPIARIDGEPKFYRRLHENSSRQTTKTLEEVTQWFDPDANAPDKSSGWKRSYNYFLQSGSAEYLKAIFLVKDLTFSVRTKAVLWLFRRRLQAKVRRVFGSK